MKNQKFTVGIIILKKGVFEITTPRVVLLIKCVNLALPPVSIPEVSDTFMVTPVLTLQGPSTPQPSR